MALKVFRYELDGVIRTSVAMPKGADILKFGWQQRDPGRGGPGVFSIWALIDDEEEQLNTRHFCLVGTGHALPELDDNELIQIVGSALMPDNFHVFHLFEYVLSGRIAQKVIG